MSETVPQKNKGGRPKIQLDYEQIQKLAELHCTRKEIAYVIGCSQDTIKRDATAVEAIERGYSYGKIKLRRAMLKNACEHMNAATQIFLAKNLLSMSDAGLVNGDEVAPLPWNEEE